MWVTAVMGETRHSSRWQESSGSRLLQLSDLDLVVSDGRILRTANYLQVQMLFEFPLGGRVVKKKKKRHVTYLKRLPQILKRHIGIFFNRPARKL